MRQPALSLLAILALAACGPAAAPSPPGSADRLRGDLNVFAAASLTDAFNAAGDAFQKANPEVKVILDFAGTPTLLAQIQLGAAADVLASADQPNMQKALDRGLVTGTTPIFARNRLEIVVAAGNPRHVTGLADLARQDVLYIAEAPSVPAGKYAAQALAAAGVKANPKSLETDVKSVVSKVQLGEADAGIVYVTDVRAAGPKVTGVAIPDAQNVVASYPVAVVKGSPNATAAGGFIDYLLSRGGQALLESFGFAPA